MAIEVNNLNKKFGDFVALNNINLEIKKNTIVSIVGPNGSGKTTLVKCLSTLLLFDDGEIEFLGEKFEYNKYKNFRKRISVLLDSSRSLYFNLTVMQNIQYFLEIKGSNFKDKKDIINYYINEFSLEQHTDKLISSLSRGMQQKTALIIALTQNSDLLILDEPNLGLDLNSLSTLKKILKEECKNKTIILTSQDVQLIEDISDYLVVLDNGKVKYNGSIDNFNSLSQVLICSIYLDKKVVNEHKADIEQFGTMIEYKDKIIYGYFHKKVFDLMLKILQDKNYRILDIKTHNVFENSLKTILNDRGINNNVQNF